MMLVRLTAHAACLCLVGAMSLWPVQAQDGSPDAVSALIEQLGDAEDADRLAILTQLVDRTYRRAPGDAVQYSDEAITLLDRFPDEALERQLLMQTGRAYDTLRDTTQMLRYAKRLREMDDVLAAGHAAFLTGRTRIRQRRYAGAERSLLVALERYTAMGHDRYQTTVLYNLGISTRRQDKLEVAHDYYDRVSTAYAALGDVRNQGNAVYWMGRVALEAEAFAYAAEVLTDAVALREAVGDSVDLASTHYYAGQAYEEQGDYDQAFVHHTAAFALREALGATFDMARSMNALGDLHEDQGDLQEARALYERARDLFRDMDRLAGVAATTNNMGTTYLAAEEWVEAQAAFATYLDLSRELGDVVREARAYQNLGIAYAGQGNAATALDYFDQARALFRAQGRREPLADTYRSTAQAFAALGAYEEALAAADSSLVLAEALGALPVVREAQQVRGRILEAMGRFADALAAERAAEVAEDALFNPQSQEVIAEVQGAFQTREQRARIAALEQQQQAQRRWLATLVGGVLLMGVIVALLARQQRSRRRELDALERARQAEAERAASLEAADAIKSQFLANISHELRTPLTLALGPVRDLLDGRFEDVDEAQPYFERAERNGERLRRMINQLLEVAELDAGAVSLHLKRHDIAAFCREIVALFDDFARQRGITLTADLTAEPLMLVYDTEHLEKILANLLSNAIKFTSAGGTIGLRVTAAEDTVCLEVRDTGEGIAPEHLPHLFDRFYQANQSNTRRHEGSGIGLALVKELVELHDGHVEAESTLGEGTTVRIYLPTTLLPNGPHLPSEPDEKAENALAASAETQYADDESLAVATEGERPVVLLVEDNADMRAYVRAHLDDGYRVIEASDGQQGLEAAQAEVPDLVISDVMMPEMDGVVLTNALKTDVRTSHIPIVLLTARAAVKDRIAGFEAGADAYLPKPFDPSDLREVVSKWVETYHPGSSLKEEIAKPMVTFSPRNIGLDEELEYENLFTSADLEGNKLVGR
ncbi:MAG: ATP-binding protein, partial [Bacteroidota bacterium]